MTDFTTWIVLFRGVGGATQLPVKPLRASLQKAGFLNVATYINSGNAVVRSDHERNEVLELVTKCALEFGFNKDIHIRSLAEWEKLIANNPFPEAVATPKHLHAAVLGATPRDAEIRALKSVASARERIAVVEQVAYLHTPDGFGRSKLAMKFDKGIGVANTARNWRTVKNLAQLAHVAMQS